VIVLTDWKLVVSPKSMLVIGSWEVIVCIVFVDSEDKFIIGGLEDSL